MMPDNFSFKGFCSVLSDLLISFIVAIAMYFITLGIIKFIRTVNLRSSKIDPTLLPITITVIKYSAFILTVFIILNIFGANTNGIIAFLGAAGIGLALALKDTLQNIASGIMLLFLRPFKKDDYIECSSNIGTVQEINLFSTTLKTPDGLFLFVPNNLLWNSSIKNFSRFPIRRLDFIVGVSYSTQIDEAKEILLNLARLDGRIVTEPTPIIAVTALADSAINIMLRCWVNNDDYWNVNFYLHKSVKEAFDVANISIPFPQRDIRLHISNENSANDKAANLTALK